MPTGDGADLSRYRSELGKWEKAEGLAQSGIVCTASGRAQQHIRTCESAKEMWEKLHGFFENKSETTVHLLSQQWYSLKKSKEETVSEYVSKV